MSGSNNQENNNQNEVALEAYREGNEIYDGPHRENEWFEEYGKDLTAPQPEGYTIPIVRGQTCEADYAGKGGDVEYKSCTLTTKDGKSVSLWVDRNLVDGLITQGVGLGQEQHGEWHSLYDYWRAGDNVVGQHPHSHINSPNHSDGHGHER